MNKTNEPNSVIVTMMLSAITCAIMWLQFRDDVLLGVFPGPDDYMRLVQVKNWQISQEWFNFKVPEVYYPQALELHWSRFPDVLIASVAHALSTWVSPELQDPLTVTVVPFLLFTVFLFCVGWAAIPLLSKSHSLNAVLFAAFALPVVMQFNPGRIDHHQVQLILLALSIGCLLRMQVVEKKNAFYSAAIGVLFAIALWVGTEILPWIIAMCATFWLFWMFGYKDPVDGGFWLGLTFLFSSLLILWVSQPQAERWIPVCDAHSVVSVGIASMVFFFWASIKLMRRQLRGSVSRILFSSVVASVLVAFFFIAFPACTQSPYGDIDPLLAEYWIPNISEAMNIFALGSVAPQFLIPNVIALVYLGYLFFTQRDSINRELWSLAIFLILGILIACWQARFFPFTQLISVFIVAHLATQIWQNFDASLSKVKRLAMVVGTVVILGPIPGLALTKLLEEIANEPGIELDTKNCSALNLMDQLASYPPETKVGTLISLGSELVYHGGYHVPAAPYHRNSIANSLVFNLLSSESDEAAQQIATTLSLDVIAVCSDHPEYSFYTDRGFSTFAERLDAGDYPKWLIPLDNAGFHSVFEVAQSPNRTSNTDDGDEQVNKQ